MVALFTGSKEPPWAYIEYILCKEVYHCRPSELDEEDWERVNLHLQCMATEAKVREHKERHQSLVAQREGKGTNA